MALFKSTVVSRRTFLLLGALLVSIQAFAPRPAHTTVSSTRLHFFQNIKQAFENDESLSQDDKLAGMLEGPEVDMSDDAAARGKLTATQERWRARMEGASPMPSLDNTAITMSFFLMGVPDKDPSNNLFSQKENISSRDRQVGLSLPKEATLTDVRVQFLPNSKTQCTSANGFTLTDTPGDWKLSDDGRQVRFRVPVSGYTRTIQTKGSIQKIYWSQQDEVATATSTSYTIPAGWLYGEAELSADSQGAVEWTNGVLKVEKVQGLLGASTTMVPCGKFAVDEQTSSLVAE